MYRIGEFSRMTKVTVKALRHYDETGLLRPAYVDEWTNYRYYTTAQLYTLQKIVSLRQAGLSIAEIGGILSGQDAQAILLQRQAGLERERAGTEERLTRIGFLLQHMKEDCSMNYQAVVKQIPGYTVYYKEGRIKGFPQMVDFILGAGKECAEANPGISCVEPDYCFVSYLDSEFTESDILVEYVQAVTAPGTKTESIRFRTLEPADAVCVYHRGGFENVRDAYAYAYNWLEQNGCRAVGNAREHYIDGMWNCDKEEDWLTEIQIPVAAR